MNVMDAGDDGRCSTLTVHGTHMGMHDEEDHRHHFFDLKADGWSTALCECMSPDATSIFDWGYVCTSCACPCLQFYFNWLSILKGAPVCGLHLKTCRCLPGTSDPHMLHGLHDACMLALSVPGSVFSPRALCAAFEGMPANAPSLAFCVNRTRDSIAWQAPVASAGTQCMLPV